MTATVDPTASVQDLCYVNGDLKIRMRDKDGKITYQDIPHAPHEHSSVFADRFISKTRSSEFMRRFSETETVPNDFVPTDTSPLISKCVAKEVATLQENAGNSDVVQKMLMKYIDTIFAFHGLLIRVVGSPETLAARTDKLEIKDSALREYVLLQMRELGGPWLDVMDKIK
jgi:hypothetical protein